MTRLTYYSPEISELLWTLYQPLATCLTGVLCVGGWVCSERERERERERDNETERERERERMKKREGARERRECVYVCVLSELLWTL